MSSGAPGGPTSKESANNNNKNNNDNKAHIGRANAHTRGPVLIGPSKLSVIERCCLKPRSNCAQACDPGSKQVGSGPLPEPLPHVSCTLFGDRVGGGGYQSALSLPAYPDLAFEYGHAHA